MKIRKKPESRIQKSSLDCTQDGFASVSEAQPEKILFCDLFWYSKV
jgi:hypothetical protein